MENKLLTASQCKNMDAAMQLAELAIDNALQVEALLADLARQLAQEAAASATALGGAGSRREVVQRRAQYVRQTTALMIDGACKLAAIDNATRARFSRLLTERLVAGTHELLDAFQSFFSVLPSQNAEALDAMQRALAATHAAFEHMEAVAATAFARTKLRRRPATRAARAGTVAPVESPPA
ncbi:MAG: phasin family protein [Rhodocyclaceae bacterium]|nr:phasin family protein [Rhodocyclaceae bacterium]